MLSSLLVAVMLSATAAETPAVCTAKIAAMPDFCQTDESGKFDNGGKVFCGPVAASNSLVWLAQNGFPKLLPPVKVKSDEGNGSADGDSKVAAQKGAQIELIRTLGSPDFMGTEGRDGTSATRLMRGLKKYVTSHGYEVEKLEYRGWSNINKTFKFTEEKPTLEWMKENIAHPGAAAWLNIGWYKFDPTTKVYQRTGGHWITLVGYGLTEDGKPDESVLIVHDPSRRSGPGIVTHHMPVAEIKEGKLIHNTSTLSTNAAGHFKSAGSFVVKKGNDAAVIDGVVVMELKK
jgi:hypothetical protein